MTEYHTIRAILARLERIESQCRASKKGMTLPRQAIDAIGAEAELAAELAREWLAKFDAEMNRESTE